ncbi:MAG: serine/threonine-protein kinase [Chthoniobacterales bacterium]
MPDAAPLQACPACGTAVDTSAVEPLASVVCPKCGEKFRAQKSFDHFLLVETLGVGGMGSVYKARDTRLDRFVALKLLRKELSADPEEAARLEQEARLTAAVNHPHVIQVYSTGHAHDQIYLVMELVDHGSLDDLMAQHPRVPEAEVLRAGIQVAKGLQAAHEKGLIHRDVKPANILFANTETAKIGDFGLAVTAGQHAEVAQEIWGTPYYVAPERLNNEPEDFRSDIYSLGATLFHALTGQPPIEGETTSASELRKLKSHPPDLRSINPEISRPTARIIMQMIAPEPSQRFASYGDLIQGLESAAAGGEPQPASGGKGRTLLLIILGLLAVAAIIGGVVYFQRAQPAAPPNLAPSSPSPTSTASTTKAPSPTPRDTAAERERDAKKQAAAKAAAEKKAEEAKRQQLLAAESPAWEKALAEARAKVAQYEFPAALEAINSAQVSEPSLAEAQANERKKMAWLIAWKNQLIADLNAGHFRAPVEIGGIKYTGAAKANDSEITFRLPFGTAPLDWKKVPAKLLLQISLSVFQPSAPDAADRDWLAAVFAAETGQPEAARPLAAAAAKAKSEYQEQLDLITAAKP